MTVTINPLDAACGAEVTGLDLSGSLDGPDLEAVNRALLDHLVLCVRGQDLEPPAFSRAANRFGQTKKQLLRQRRHDAADDVSIISNHKPDEKGGDGKPYVGAIYWHTDDSYLAEPAKITMLHARELPSRGGDTQFINCFAVLDAMPDEMRRRIEGMRAVHVYRSRRGKSRVAERTEAERSETPDVVHPLIRTHPESGRKALFINPNRIDHIEGQDAAASDEILDELYEFAFRPEFQYHHDWRPGDLVMWDNRCTMHRADPEFDQRERRIMHRVLIEGDTPY